MPDAVATEVHVLIALGDNESLFNDPAGARAKHCPECDTRLRIGPVKGVGVCPTCKSILAWDLSKKFSPLKIGAL